MHQNPTPKIEIEKDHAPNIQQQQYLAATKKKKGSLTVAEYGLPHVLGDVLSLEGELLESKVKVHVHGLCVSDVKVAIRLRREPSPDL